MAHESRRGMYFSIRSNAFAYLVLEVQDAYDAAGVAVVTAAPHKEATPQGNDHQLWYCHPSTATIRSKLNDLCIDLLDDCLIVSPYQSGSANQMWLLYQDRIQSREDFELVLGISDDSGQPGARVEASQDEAVDTQSWVFEYSSPRYFYIRTSEFSKVWDVKGNDVKDGAKVIIFHDKGDMADNQLWYEDTNGIIRSKLNSFAIDMSGKNPTLVPYSEKNSRQQWVIGGASIQNNLQRNEVLATKQKGLFSTMSIVVEQSQETENQTWTIDYIHSDAACGSHSGAGRDFVIASAVNGIVLEVQEGATGRSMPIVTSYRCEDQGADQRQRFHCDQSTGTIRTDINDFCLALEVVNIVAKPYDSHDHSQQWRTFGRKIQSRNNLNLVVEVVDGNTEPGAYVCAADYNNENNQHWQITHMPAMCFNVISKMHGFLLTVDMDKCAGGVGANVVVSEPEHMACTNQMWYQDETELLRSKVNGYVLDSSEREIKLRPFIPTNEKQQWIVVGELIQNKTQTDHVLDISGANRKSGAAVISFKAHGGINQKWKFKRL